MKEPLILQGANITGDSIAARTKKMHNTRNVNVVQVKKIITLLLIFIIFDLPSCLDSSIIIIMYNDNI